MKAPTILPYSGIPENLTLRRLAELAHEAARTKHDAIQLESDDLIVIVRAKFNPEIEAEVLKRTHGLVNEPNTPLRNGFPETGIDAARLV